VVRPPEVHAEILIAPQRITDAYVLMPERFTLLTDKELFALLALFRHKAPRDVLEVGTYRGGSALHFFLNSPPTTKITSLDRDFQSLSRDVEKQLLASGRFELWQISSEQIDEKRHAEAFDFIFIDGSHEYLDVRRDTEKCLAMLREDGMIVWDDYNPAFPGVFRTLNELRHRGYDLRNIEGTSLVYYQALPNF